MLKKCLGDPSLAVLLEDIGVKHSLSNEEVSIKILDRKVQKLRTKDITSIKVLWRNQRTEEATWESEEDIKTRYFFLFPPLDEVA